MSNFHQRWRGEEFALLADFSLDPLCPEMKVLWINLIPDAISSGLYCSQDGRARPCERV